MWVFKSSQTMKSTLGALLSAAKEANEAARIERVTTKKRIYQYNESPHPSGQAIVDQTKIETM